MGRMQSPQSIALSKKNLNGTPISAIIYTHEFISALKSYWPCQIKQSKNIHNWNFYRYSIFTTFAKEVSFSTKICLVLSFRQRDEYRRNDGKIHHLK